MAHAVIHIATVVPKAGAGQAAQCPTSTARRLPAVRCIAHEENLGPTLGDPPERQSGSVGQGDAVEVDQVLLALCPALVCAMTIDPTPSIMTNNAAKMKCTLTR